MPGTCSRVAWMHFAVFFGVQETLWKSPRNFRFLMVRSFVTMLARNPCLERNLQRDLITLLRIVKVCSRNSPQIEHRYVRNTTLFVSFCLSIIGAALVNTLPPPGLSDASAFNDMNVRRYGAAAIAVSAFALLALLIAEVFRRWASNRFSLIAFRYT